MGAKKARKSRATSGQVNCFLRRHNIFTNDGSKKRCSSPDVAYMFGINYSGCQSSPSLVTKGWLEHRHMMKDHQLSGSYTDDRRNEEPLGESG